ncbi:protein kinase [bacterium]|nr:protein kinase [bacterium]
MNKELHLILLWQNARYKQKEILEDIQKNLTISECIEIEWSKKNIASNFTRFYGVKLPNHSCKEKECGKGKFLLVTVWDNNPKYEFVETSRGFEKVNTNIFNLKDKYRSWTRGGHKVHSTNTVPETNHDITLLLGINYNDYTKNAPKIWDGTIKKIRRDLTGANGWKDLKELFYTLNATINYCVLRNYEILPEQFKSELHGDIDLLTDNYKDLVFLTNAKPVFRQKYRVHHKVTISGQNVFFDFRFLGDNYYCPEFEENILYNRVLNDKNIYVPDCENAFYSLIYHCLIHKKTIAADYYPKVKTLFDKVNIDNKQEIDEYKYPFDYYYKILNEFIYSNHYHYTKPQDLSVFYNEKCINIKNIAKWLKNTYNIQDIKPYMLGLFATPSGYQFLTGNLNGQKIFIKWGGLADSCLTEYKTGKTLYQNSKNHFVEPLLFNYNNNKNFIATEFIDGKMLSDIMNEGNISRYPKELFAKQLQEIAETLESESIIHRDIRPNNIIITKDNILKLIDLQFATSYKPFKIRKNLLLKWHNLHDLGGEYKVKTLCWDDMFSINKIINELGLKNQNIENKIGKHRVDLFGLRILIYILETIIQSYRIFRSRKR